MFLPWLVCRVCSVIEKATGEFLQNFRIEICLCRKINQTQFSASKGETVFIFPHIMNNNWYYYHHSCYYCIIIIIIHCLIFYTTLIFNALIQKVSSGFTSHSTQKYVRDILPSQSCTKLNTAKADIRKIFLRIMNNNCDYYHHYCYYCIHNNYSL